jgi:hypothetical protein
MRELIEKKLAEAQEGLWTPKMDAEGWKLYDPETAADEKKTKKAVSALNSAMKKFQKAVRKALSKVPEYDTKTAGPIGGELYDKIIGPVHSKFRSVGADDTPVREISTLAAIQMVKDVYGKTGWTKLGDYIG